MYLPTVLPHLPNQSVIKSTEFYFYFLLFFFYTPASRSVLHVTHYTLGIKLTISNKSQQNQRRQIIDSSARCKHQGPRPKVESNRRSIIDLGFRSWFSILINRQPALSYPPKRVQLRLILTQFNNLQCRDTTPNNLQWVQQIPIIQSTSPINQ